MSELKRILIFLLLVTCQVILEKKIFQSYQDTHKYIYIPMWASTQLSKTTNQKEKWAEGSEQMTHGGVRLLVKHRKRNPTSLMSQRRIPAALQVSLQTLLLQTKPPWTMCSSRVREGRMCSGLNGQPSVLLPRGGAFVHPRRAFVMSWAAPSPLGSRHGSMA